MEPKERYETLLKEYELCLDKTKHLDKNIWTTSGFIGAGSIVSLLFSNYTGLNSLLVVLAGILIIGGVWTWWKIAIRWWDIQHSIFTRMSNIEKEIGFYQNRYQCCPN
jgi:hypothetical protein